jgi:ADP-heptose:LPS heptosyltransferase
MKILVVKRDKIGDLLLTGPLFAALRAHLPGAQIDLLANDYNAWVARDFTTLSNVYAVPRVRHAGRLRLSAVLAQPRLYFALRGMGYDWAIVAGGEESHRAIRRAIGTGARRVVAYASEPGRYGRRLTHPLPSPSSGHEIDRMLDLLGALGFARPPGRPAPSYMLPESGHVYARAFLAQHGLKPDRYIVLGFGARRAKKQPAIAQIVRWTSEWKARFGLDTVFMWTPGAATGGAYPGDDALVAPLLALNLPHVIPFRGPIPEALGLIYSARTSVIPDSGLMHFAAASPGGVFGLFADPSDSAPAARWAPIGMRARYVEAPRTIAELPDHELQSALAPLVERSPF